MIYVVRLWDEKQPHEGTRLGTVRRPPRGLPKARQPEVYDVWLPELAPSPDLARWSRANPSRSWASFERRYRREMKDPAPRHLIGLLAFLSHDQNLSVGCYCDDYHQCHRSTLCQLLAEAGAEVGPIPNGEEEEWVDG